MTFGVPPVQPVAVDTMVVVTVWAVASLRAGLNVMVPVILVQLTRPVPVTFALADAALEPTLASRPTGMAKRAMPRTSFFIRLFRSFPFPGACDCLHDCRRSEPASALQPPHRRGWPPLSRLGGWPAA